MNNFIVGIDIGSSKVCGAVGKVDKFGNLQIVGITSVICSGVKKAVVVDIDSTSEAIIQCVQQLEKMVDIHITHAFISLPGGICDLNYNKGKVAISPEDNKIKNADIKKVLDAAQSISLKADKEIVGIIPTQYTVDEYDNIDDPIGMSGEKLEVEAQIITCNTDIVNDLFKCFNKANIKIEGIVIQPIGAAEVLLKKEEKDMGIALLDVGADTANISIFIGGFLCYTEIIPLGGNSITKDISTCLKLDLQEAERIKIKFGNVSTVREEEEELIQVSSSYENIGEVKYSILSEIVEARVEEILSFVYKKIQQSGFYNEISGVVITGGGISLFKGITEISKEIMGKNVKVVSPEYVGASSPIYSNCLGIVQYIAKNTWNVKTEENYKKTREDDFMLKKVKSEKQGKGMFSKLKHFLGDFF